MISRTVLGVSSRAHRESGNPAHRQLFWIERFTQAEARLLRTKLIGRGYGTLSAIRISPLRPGNC